MELDPTPVSAADGVEVRLLEREPPGVDDALDFTVVVVTGLFELGASVVVVFEPETVVVVAATAVVVVVAAADFTVDFLWFDFDAEVGPEDPQAAAARPAAMSTAPTLISRATRRRSRLVHVGAEPIGICKAIRPHSLCGPSVESG
jgi:hypothetical protein